MKEQDDDNTKGSSTASVICAQRKKPRQLYNNKMHNVISWECCPGLSQTQHLCSWQTMFLILWIGPVTFPIHLNYVNTTKFPGSTPLWVKNHHLCSGWPGSLWFYFMSPTTFSGRSWGSYPSLLCHTPRSCLVHFKEFYLVHVNNS